MAYETGQSWHNAMDACMAEGLSHGWKGKLLTLIDLDTFRFVKAAHNSANILSAEPWIGESEGGRVRVVWGRGGWGW